LVQRSVSNLCTAVSQQWHEALSAMQVLM